MLTVVGMTDIFLVMAGLVVISVAVMLIFAGTISDYMNENPDFEILGLFVLLLISFVLILEGGHVAHLAINDSAFPYIPQWIVTFILLFMFTVDLYQNWLERKREQQPVTLRRRKSGTAEKQYKYQTPKCMQRTTSWYLKRQYPTLYHDICINFYTIQTNKPKPFRNSGLQEILPDFHTTVQSGEHT
ncbi:MAG: hypothetical protein ACI8ZB_003069 [Desulforhopalus sp.]|jgi:hypothetical protein